MKKHPLQVLLSLVFAGILSLSCNMTSTIFATPTPTVTNTPTITPSPIPTNTPTPTPTLTPLPSGILINEEPDGSTEFIDYDGGYKLVAPSGWTAIPLEKEKIDEILSASIEQNPQYEAIISYLNSVDSSVYRVFFFDFRSEHTNGQFASNINVIFQKDDLTSGIPLNFIVSSTAENLKMILPDVEVLSTGIRTLDSGIELGEIEVSQIVTNAVGTKTSIYQKVIIFKAGGGVVDITFSLPIDQQEILQPEIDDLVDSIMLLSL